MPITLDGTAGITTPEIISTGGPVVINASAPDNSMVMDASGNVGIGTASPTGKLAVVGTANGETFRVQKAGGTNLTLLRVNMDDTANTGTIEVTGAAGNPALAFATVGTERMRIDATGNVFVTQTPGKYTVDTTGGATSLANGGTVDFANSSGMLLVNNHNTGDLTLYLCGGGSTSVIANRGAQVGTFTYVIGIAGYRWTNNTGVTATFGFFFVRTRPTA